MGTVEIIGRSTSHFTRVATMFARELDVPYELVVVRHLTTSEPDHYHGHPALKLPMLRRDGSLLFGAANICRALVELAPRPRRIVWPEDLRDDLARNAQELVWHAMSAQVQLVLGVEIGKLPADHPFFAKLRAGYAGALAWLDANVEAVLAALPAERDLSLFEVTLFCMFEHLAFRPALPREPYPALRRFVESYGARASAQQTPYVIDP